MLTMNGNSGGRDVMDRAAMSLMGRLGGGQSAPQQPGQAAPTSTVADLLAQATQLTLKSAGEEMHANLAAWGQATQFLKSNLGGGPAPGAGGMPQGMPPGGPAMPGAANPMDLAAQGVPQMGRPPR
jgi:hypothetical protein